MKYCCVLRLSMRMSRIPFPSEISPGRQEGGHAGMTAVIWDRREGLSKLLCLVGR